MFLFCATMVWFRYTNDKMYVQVNKDTLKNVDLHVIQYVFYTLHGDHRSCILCNLSQLFEEHTSILQKHKAVINVTTPPNFTARWTVTLRNWHSWNHNFYSSLSGNEKKCISNLVVTMQLIITAIQAVLLATLTTWPPSQLLRKR